VGRLRYPHRHPRPPVAVAAGGDLRVFHLWHLHRCRGRDPAQRSSLSHGARRGDARAHPPGGRDHRAPRHPERRTLPDLFRLSEFPARLRQLSHALHDAHRLTLCGDSDLGCADRAVHHRATHQRLQKWVRAPGRAGTGAHHSAARHAAASGAPVMSAPLILLLMTFLFLLFGYLGVPVAFSLLAGVIVGAMFTDVSLAAIVQKMFDGMDSEALLAIPFFLLVGELMSSANVVVRVANLSMALVGHIR